MCLQALLSADLDGSSTTQTNNKLKLITCLFQLVKLRGLKWRRFPRDWRSRVGESGLRSESNLMTERETFKHSRTDDRTGLSANS